MRVMNAYGDPRCPTHTAISITPDGDCLFNAVSLAFWRTEERSKQLRLRTAIEIVCNRTKYDRNSSSYSVNKGGFTFEVDSYNCFLKEVLSISTYMSPAHLVALGNAVGVDFDDIW